MLKLTYHGHSCFEVNTGSYNIIIDPFLKGNKNSDIKAEDVKADFIVLSHAHGDHIGDAFDIAKKNDATIIAVNELANYAADKGCKAHNMHIGGSYEFPFGRLKFTIAHHGSSTPDGKYMGEPAGILLSIEGKCIYHSGDTGLFWDMKLIGEMNALDVAMVPIGDNFTMGINDAVKAIEFLNPKLAVPMHYNTFGVIEQDPQEFKRKVESIGKQCIVIPFGESIEI
ncbi:MAG: metal-dependent hydrolase [Ignavibacteriae bacterium]|nr:MAG: metal-dependent hydrolase [Ignavibacteriota bacterium]